ncbi:SRPBCC domain-containing protein [Saccharopolyspora sp. NPDC000359]|uniref:SRPBCC domain-containing protein n=1 Tax=Saccharopolyspora sp. NPDC000359 TaxID=3154251 RepID=UPI0033239092
MTGSIETTGQLDAVERSLAASDNGATWHAVAVLSQEHPVGVDDLWDACTRAERLSRWLPQVTGELRVGGRFHVEGNASGTIETCDAPRGFASTWEFNGRNSHIAVRLAGLGDRRSRLTLVHTADVAAYRWAQFGPGATGVGWDCMFLGLALHTHAGSMPAEEGKAWELGEEAKEFFADSSRRWADLAVKAGIPEADARAAERRTTDFYHTGVEQPL